MKNILSLLALLFLVFTGYAQETYTLSQESVLKIKGTSTIHDWTVTANSLKGTMEVNGEEVKALKFQAVVDQIKSERGAAMDKKMHAALKVEEYPEVLFKLNEIKKDDSAENAFLINGMLTIAGVGKTVDIKTEFQKVNGNCVFNGAKEIKLQDFSMEPPTAMFGQIIVGDMVTVDFNLTFSK